MLGFTTLPWVLLLQCQEHFPAFVLPVAKETSKVEELQQVNSAEGVAMVAATAKRLAGHPKHMGRERPHGTAFYTNMQ